MKGKLPTIFLHERADQDLEDIFDYSVQRFGFKRAVEYIKDIEVVFNELAEAPHKGKPFDPLSPLYLHKRIESHFIYYSACQDGIEIFRVLHERMLPQNHLPD